MGTLSSPVPGRLCLDSNYAHGRMRATCGKYKLGFALIPIMRMAESHGLHEHFHAGFALIPIMRMAEYCLPFKELGGCFALIPIMRMAE